MCVCVCVSMCVCCVHCVTKPHVVMPSAYSVLQFCEASKHNMTKAIYKQQNLFNNKNSQVCVPEVQALTEFLPLETK